MCGWGEGGGNVHVPGGQPGCRARHRCRVMALLGSKPSVARRRVLALEGASKVGRGVVTDEAVVVHDGGVLQLEHLQQLDLVLRHVLIFWRQRCLRAERLLGVRHEAEVAPALLGGPSPVLERLQLAG